MAHFSIENIKNQHKKSLFLLLLVTSISVQGYLKYGDFLYPSRISYSAEVWHFCGADFDLKSVTKQLYQEYCN
jgi:hypothetical protein